LGGGLVIKEGNLSKSQEKKGDVSFAQPKKNMLLGQEGGAIKSKWDSLYRVRELKVGVHEGGGKRDNKNELRIWREKDRGYLLQPLGGAGRVPKSLGKSRTGEIKKFLTVEDGGRGTASSEATSCPSVYSGRDGVVGVWCTRRNAVR